MPETSPDTQVVAYLADAHAIEEQALVQMRAAPDIAGDERLAGLFRDHLAETEEHERLVRERLDALDGSPSKVKDVAGRAGGWGMVLFARAQPDTPGKLVAHAYAYEHMELAAYALLERVAAMDGDAGTTRIAHRIAEQERGMGERLAGCFDEAVAASLRDVSQDDLDTQLDHYLADAHAIERQAVQLLERGSEMADDELAAAFDEHLEQTRGHLAMLEERLDARGAKASIAKDMALTMGAMNLGAFFGAQPDTTVKLSGFAYAFEHLEIAAYELLRRVAQRAGDAATMGVADRILADERIAAQRIATTWDPSARHQVVGS